MMDLNLDLCKGVVFNMANIKEMNFIKDKIKICEKCSLHLSRNNTVPGEGNINSKIVFVGEGPGADEDSSGRPFVGRAGKLLDVMLKDWAKIDRNQIFITNIVKCRPPKNRVPSDEEMNSCGHFLEAQLIQIKPKIIVTLGSTSMKYLTNKTKITESRGKFYDWYSGIKIFPTFHPSYLLRNPSMQKGTPRWYSWLDMRAIGIMIKALNNDKNVEDIVKAVTKIMKDSGGI
jgi:DNA polymerase